MPEIIRAFLSPAELHDLRCVASSVLTWTPGRQGTGYDISQFRHAPPSAVTRALAHLGTPHEQHWDAYLIRYRDGAHIPPHLDPAQHGLHHRRLNAMLTQATCGGELRIDGALIALDPGDAVLFYSDLEVHEVSPVIGTRLLLSVGAWL